VISVGCFCRAGSNFDEFRQFKYPQFRDRLNDLRKQIRQKNNHAARDSAALAHYRGIYPKSPLNHRGEPRWEGSEAARLLREDVQQRMHENMPPEQLWLSRDEYQNYHKDTFRQHIHQEVRASKNRASYIQRKDKKKQSQT